jgi:hypothetical protein
MDTPITRELLEKAMTYKSYKDMVSRLITENKTTGPKQSENLVNFTKLNLERVKRIEKTTNIDKYVKEEIRKINRPMYFLLIAEAWCGDVAQNLPVINKIAELNKNIELRIILRDENPDVMNEFLTNGTKSIPICILIDEVSLHVLGKWGPRPEPAQKMMAENKRRPVLTRDELIKKIQRWYAEDKGKTIQKEFVKLVQSMRIVGAAA